MLTRLIVIVAAMTAPVLPAAAQNAPVASPEARFRTAQERFDRELRLFRSEYDIYQSSRRLPPSYLPPRGDEDRNAPRLSDPYDEPGTEDGYYDEGGGNGRTPYYPDGDEGPQ